MVTNQYQPLNIICNTYLWQTKTIPTEIWYSSLILFYPFQFMEKLPWWWSKLIQMNILTQVHTLPCWMNIIGNQVNHVINFPLGEIYGDKKCPSSTVYIFLTWKLNTITNICLSDLLVSGEFISIQKEKLSKKMPNVLFSEG